MRKIKRISVPLMIAFVMLIGSIMPASAGVREPLLEATINDAASYMYKTVVNPGVSSVGGEWVVIGLARSTYPVPEQYYEKYYNNVESYVKAKDGNLDDRKNTEYSRLIIALTAIGKDPTNVGGYNLLTALGDYDKTIWQGLNGPIWALIALESGNYQMPQNPKAKTQASRQMYVDRILAYQLLDGGWSLLGDTTPARQNEKSDPDITGMVLQALAKYQDQPRVKKATNEALMVMSKQQHNDGGYLSDKKENLESTVQMIVALSELGISLDHPMFVKNGNTLIDKLMTFYNQENDSGQMALEQELYGLVAAYRAVEGKNSLYRMGDVLKSQEEKPTPEVDTKADSGLAGKHKDIKLIPVTAPGRSFDDISHHKNKTAIEALASRKIINGKSENSFAPNDTVTRAEFATIIINSLGLNPKVNSKFEDIAGVAWYAPYVGAANSYGIVAGVSETAFNPSGTITKQEAAVMIARAAKLAGMSTEVDAIVTRDVLAQFTDYIRSKEWARPSLAFAYQENILNQSDMEINPGGPMSRGEIAQIVFNMLGAANLL